MPYWRLYYHVVWATRRRTPWLEGDAADIVEAAIRSHLHALRGLVHGVAVRPDHVHVAVSLPPSVLLSDAIGQIKGRSSNLVRVRHPRLADEGFSWQGDYGVISFREPALKQVQAYIANQETHHRESTVNGRFERTSGLEMMGGGSEPQSTTM